MLTDDVTTTHYTSTVTLVSGLNYKFKIQARNIVGYSALSSELIVRAAEVPEAPTNVITNNNV